MKLKLLEQEPTCASKGLRMHCKMCILWYFILLQTFESADGSRYYSFEVEEAEMADVVNESQSQEKTQSVITAVNTSAGSCVIVNV